MEYKLKNYKLAGEKAQFLYDEIELIDDQDNMDAFNISKKTNQYYHIKYT